MYALLFRTLSSPSFFSNDRLQANILSEYVPLPTRSQKNWISLLKICTCFLSTSNNTKRTIFIFLFGHVVNISEALLGVEALKKNLQHHDEKNALYLLVINASFDKIVVYQTTAL
jgi:hypothetical protein